MFEDYAVLTCGASIFKIARLLSIALLSVHLFACAFYRVKKETANSPDDVVSFYSSKNVDPTVSPALSATGCYKLREISSE